MRAPAGFPWPQPRSSALGSSLSLLAVTARARVGGREAGDVQGVRLSHTSSSLPCPSGCSECRAVPGMEHCAVLTVEREQQMQSDPSSQPQLPQRWFL